MLLLTPTRPPRCALAVDLPFQGEVTLSLFRVSREELARRLALFFQFVERALDDGL